MCVFNPLLLIKVQGNQKQVEEKTTSNVRIPTFFFEGVLENTVQNFEVLQLNSEKFWMVFSNTPEKKGRYTHCRLGKDCQEHLIKTGR